MAGNNSIFCIDRKYRRDESGEKVAKELEKELGKELEDGLAKGPYVAETFAVHVEDSYVIIET